tara:strand:+ start:395 stop:589 length:195 start_codon:yes stop_codon:yes gene_type:complete
LQPGGKLYLLLHGKLAARDFEQVERGKKSRFDSESNHGLRCEKMMRIFQAAAELAGDGNRELTG